MLKIQRFEFSPFAENTYVVHGEAGQCLIIDPGCYNVTEEMMLKDYITENGLTPVALLNTHAHIDHIFGNHFVKSTWNTPIYLHHQDLMLIERAEAMAHLWNLKFTPSPMPDENLESVESLNLAGISLEVRHVPGHAPGHVVFTHHDSRQVICGDTLFRGSIGRTDLPGGNHDLLISSIRSHLFTLPDDYTLLSGHGPETTVGEERMHNPFF